MRICGKFKECMVIAVASQKGGVGKTTSSISLAAGLARRDKKVLLIDIDSQANSSKVLLPTTLLSTKSRRFTTPFWNVNRSPFTQLQFPI